MGYLTGLCGRSIGRASPPCDGEVAAIAAAPHFPLTLQPLWVFLNLPPLSATVGFARWVEVPTATDVIPN